MDEMMNHYDHMVDDTKTDEGIIERADELESRIDNSDLYRWIVPEFEILNLVPVKDDIRKSEWRSVGNVTADQATVNTILYIGADKVPDYIMYDGPDGPNYRPDSQNNPESRPLMYMTNSGKHRFRVVTNIAPPFVIESTKLDNNTCLTGDFCLKIETNVREDLISIFTDFRSQRRLYENKKYVVKCCAGIAIDLLNAVARDLHFDYDLYLVADGLFGVKKDGQWDGVTADLVNDLAHLTFTAFSTTSSRVQAIDYSVPFFYSGVSCLSVSSNETDVPLLAFLIPFSYELWAAIFAGLFATAVAAAIYEWFSPFGLNPWGRQRTKNFSLASALWVMCSLLFSHLVAFKAPKSWPNKVLINVWGAFSVIFLATYTANIAAHFAGLFLVPEVNDFHDTSRTGTARSSASEGYLMEKYTDLWHYIKRHKVDSFDEGLEHLRAGILDVLIGDTAILDYFRATDPGCSLRLLGDSIFDDAYAVGMQKGFPFRYNEYGFLDQLHRKWYGRVHCLESSSLTKPKPLTVRAEAGVFLMLGFGILVGIIILFAEHFVFKYILPLLRKKSKDCFWKSPNLMFFSQKLYRFINTVELVSPHHSAKEIITNLREGQIASLFQKSVKRKAKEEARRRKSKSQFFEMIQEVRKVVQRQQQERSLQEDDDDDDNEEMLKLGLDEESINNTNANRATRASFMFSKENSLIEQDRIGNRVSAIRFKEPEIFDDLNRRLIDINRKPEGDTNRRLISNLKYGDQNITGPLARTETCNYDQNDQNEQIKRRREALRKCHLSSNSFSLEDIFFQGLLSEGVNGPKKSFPKCGRRILSFEDLPAIKKELSESSNDHYDGNSPYDLSLERPSSRTSTTRGRISKATTVPFDLSHHRHRPIDHNVSGLSRNDILSLWQASERELMLRLEESIEQRRVLEEKIALLQRTLMKPP
ncbi:Glutamate receptor ionotropic, NMDA 3A [Blomia tropicalis]|nr:Glutamate receptor ionotropic, NMDA 3A [Blomia tropicalis]